VTAAAPYLEARALSKSFGALHVIQNVELSLAAGERRALIGPNGAGKTTLINLLAGRLRLDSGTILMDGTDITGLAEAERARTGLGRTFQINSLFRNLTVFENIYLAVAERLGTARHMLRPALAEEEAVGRSRDLMRELGIAADARTVVQQLPYGHQRLVEIAIALALKPKVLLLDEPAAGVPTGESGLILELIAALPKDIAVLLIDHDMDIVFRFAERITVLAQGMILAEGAPDEIARDARVREVYLGRRKHG
jgi:ABC-type branched-subunit amino acid transport system ATPase component